MLERFAERFEQHWVDGMRAKLGLFTREDEDRTLAEDLLAWMQRHSADFTNTFRSLTAGRAIAGCAGADAELDAWHGRWEARLARQPQSVLEVRQLMRKHNPAIIPRNHVVEEALVAATDENDLSALERLLDAVATPYDHDRDLPAFTAPGAGGYRTFCGT